MPGSDSGANTRSSRSVSHSDPTISPNETALIATDAFASLNGSRCTPAMTTVHRKFV